MDPSSQNSTQLKLQLVANLPENKVCFDCGTPKGNWVSVNNGVFLCIQCAGHHRQLGVHVSFLRSVLLDTWTAEKVALITIGGNKRANDYLISRGVNPPSSGKTRSLDTYTLYMEEYRSILKVESEYYIVHKQLLDDTPKATTNEVPSLSNIAIKACCKINALNEQIEKRNADFLRPRIIEYLASRKSLFGDNISLIRGNFITSLDLDGSQLSSKDISTIAKNCPELQSFSLVLFTSSDGLSEGLSSLIAYCSKLTTLKIEFSVVKLDARKFNQNVMPFSINLKELSLYKCIFTDTVNTFPALEDVLFLCTKLERLKLDQLQKNALFNDSIEQRFPFVTALSNYNKIVALE